MGHGRRYAQLHDLDPALARGYAESQRHAVDLVAELAEREGIEAELARTDHYVYALGALERNDMRREARIARECGLPADFSDDTPLPYPAGGGAVRYRRQVRFDPVRYTRGLAAAARRMGASFVQGLQATGIEDAGRVGWRVSTPGTQITARTVIVTTHIPFMTRGLLWARASYRRSLVLAARIPAGGWFSDATFISTEHPDHSVRTTGTHDDDALLIVSGEGSETGSRVDWAAREARLEAWMRARFELGEVAHRWAVQDVYPTGGLPMIGRVEDGLYAATGFAGWGMSNATLAGVLLSDAVTGRRSAWAGKYQPSLTRGACAAWRSPLCRPRGSRAGSSAIACGPPSLRRPPSARRSARTPGADCAGTTWSAPGTARATPPASPRRGR